MGVLEGEAGHTWLGHLSLDGGKTQRCLADLSTQIQVRQGMVS